MPHLPLINLLQRFHTVYNHTQKVFLLSQFTLHLFFPEFCSFELTFSAFFYSLGDSCMLLLTRSFSKYVYLSEWNSTTVLWSQWILPARYTCWCLGFYILFFLSVSFCFPSDVPYDLTAGF